MVTEELGGAPVHRVAESNMTEVTKPVIIFKIPEVICG